MSYDDIFTDATISYNIRGQYHQIQFANAGDPVLSRDYTYDDQGRSLSISHTHPTATYDANGNQLSGGATWDAADRLLQYGSTTFECDWRSRRIKRLNAKYTYVGQNVGRIRDTTTGVLDDYIFGPVIDEPLVRKRANGTKEYYIVGGLGSVSSVRDGSGAVVESRTYDAWGFTPVSGTFGYTGREAGSGSLVYYRARYYDPAIGRFISEDPLQRIILQAYGDGKTRQPRQVPAYGYAKNSPASFTDPLGLEPNSDANVGCVSNCVDQRKTDIYKCLKTHTYTQLACIAGFLACEGLTIGGGTLPCLYGLAVCESFAAVQWFDCNSEVHLGYLSCLKGCCT